MLWRSNQALIAGLLVMLVAQQASARKPPLPVTLDVLLKKADRILVGRVMSGPQKEFKKMGNDQPYFEFTLLVIRSLDGKDVGKQITVTEGSSFPAVVFPANKTNPNKRFLLTGWNHEGHVETSAVGLDLYAEQVWFLQRLPDDRLRNSATAPYGVDHLESVQKLEHAGLIELLAQQASVAKLRKHIQKAYQGKIPILAVQGLYGSSDPNAGALARDYLRGYDEIVQKLTDLRKKGHEFEIKEQYPLREKLAEYRPHDAYRTINSLGRERALKWARESSVSGADWGALETLKRYQDIDSVPRLLQILKASTSIAERERIILTLGEIGDARAVPALLHHLYDDTPRHSVSVALHQLTDIRFSPNGDYARRWWERNKTKPRVDWLKQGIEQDLHLIARMHEGDWDRDLDPLLHLSRATCWREPRGKPLPDPELTQGWKAWWQANKGLPQERWVLDSFRAVDHPVPDLTTAKGVEALINAYNTEPKNWWDKGPVLDPYLHHAWCQRLLTRLTGWEMEDTNSSYYYRPDWYDYKKFGALWRAEWEKSRYGVQLKPIPIPDRQPFTMAEEDRKLLCDDFDAWSAEVVFKGPIVRKNIPPGVGLALVGTFEITLTNRSGRELTLHTRPSLSGESGHQRGSGGSLSTVKLVCASHHEDFAIVRPGESIRWTEQERLHYWDKDQTWLHFRLDFDQRGKSPFAWCGRVSTPWISVPKENIRDE